MIAAKILNENELRASLKEQYIDKIDSSQEKYDIEYLFEGVQYEILDPELFALYAATDSKMTYDLYEWQLKQFLLPDNKRLFSLFLDVEMPVVEVAAEMELTGITIDTEYGQRLSQKYHKKVEEVDK
jgi:DNA polymerase-1